MADLGAIERRALAAAGGLRAADLPSGHGAAAFVTHARDDVLRLVAALRGGERLPPDELEAMAARAETAGPLPFDVFLESDGGMAGCNLIWIGGGEHEDEPDLYVCRGEEFGSDADAR